MSIQTEVQSLLQKKMDRREFIRHVGVGFAAIVGITTLIRALSSMNGNKHTTGYSAGTYGGAPKQ